MTPESGPDFTEDAVLGGRLRLRQPRRGHRVGHDAILLAAATPLMADERVVDLGAGVGAAGLALAKRVETARIVLVEIDRGLCGLARENARLNDVAERVDVIHQDVADCTLTGADRVLMNPPFNDPARSQGSPDPRRRLAHVADDDTLHVWIGAAARILKPGGTLSVIWRADGLADVERALSFEFGDVRILPVLPSDSAAAIRVLVRATTGAPTKRASLPPLVLNDARGRPTSAAEDILRGGKTLPPADL